MKRAVLPYKRTTPIRYSDPLTMDNKVYQLQRQIAITQTIGSRHLPGFALLPKIGHPLSADRYSAGIDCDEVYPNLFVGDEGAARSIPYLKLLGITAVVNAAEGTHFSQVNTGPIYYADANIKYLGLQLYDHPQTNISVHFYEVANFVDKVLAAGGRVLIHCMVGYSRSATLALAYLMIKRGMTAEEAIRTVRRHREIRPNDGFLRQLVELENKLNPRYTSSVSTRSVSFR